MVLERDGGSAVERVRGGDGGGAGLEGRGGADDGPAAGAGRRHQLLRRRSRGRGRGVAALDLEGRAPARLGGGLRRGGAGAGVAGDSRRPRERLLWPHWSRTDTSAAATPMVLALGFGAAEGCCTWSRITKAAAAADEDAAGARARGLCCSSEVLAR